MKSLIEFIQEQDTISYRRLNGLPPPWTDDPVMANYKFGNVRRELDRTNRLLYSLFATPKYKDKRDVLTILPNIVANCLAHRLVSCHDFSLRHGFFDSYEAFENAYNGDRDAGLPVRPTSFISCISDTNLLKSARVAFKLTNILADYLVRSQSLESTFYHFKKIVGKFTAWQAALDCVMHGWVANNSDFVHLGPGALFTLNVLDYPPQDYGTLVSQVNDHIKYLPLRYEEVEGLLCEYGRYVKYNTKWPGKYRLYSPDPRPLLSVPLDKIFTTAFLIVKERYG